MRVHAMRAGALMGGLLFPAWSMADWTLNMAPGVTGTSNEIFSLHMTILWICVAIGVVVFGVMFWSIFAHRKSQGAKPANFHENTLVEILWTIIPFVILVVMAIPATATLVDMYDTTESEIDIKVTGYQWRWKYDYINEEFGYFSNMSTSKDEIYNRTEKSEHYLLDVDNPMVVPVGAKVRLLLTANDVIHSWWVPDFAVKQDALPGFINEAWANVPEPGTYRGQCTELCGKDHAYMPVVVDVRPEAEFDQWVEDQRIAKELASGQAVADREKTWSLAELMEIGEGVYSTHCATCHQPNGEGQGTTYPALDGSEIATGPIPVHIDRVMNGKEATEMQAWAPQLSDRDLAAVVTYERNAWGNTTQDVVQPRTIFENR